jgi:hypothetical protein
MDLKAKIFSLIICGLLVIPVLVNPPSNKAVLGAQIDREFENNNNPKTDSKTDIPNESNIGEKSSNNNIIPDVSLNKPKIEAPVIKPNIKFPSLGLKITNPFSDKNTITKNPTTNNFAIKDISSGVRSSTQSTLEKQNLEVHGEVKWESSPSTSIITNKFELGSPVKVSTNSKETNLVISGIRALPSNITMVVDPDTFIALGGNPETQESIYSVVKLNP